MPEAKGGATQTGTRRRAAVGGPFFGWPALVTQPFTHSRGREAGITTRALESPEFRKLLHGIYVHAKVNVDAVIEARAAVLAGARGAFVSHHTAARLWGGIVPHESRLHVSVPRGAARSTRRDMLVHASTRDPVSFRGMPVTSALDTFLDLARVLDLVDLVILGDSLVKKDRNTPEDLVSGCESAKGRGCRRAREAAGLVRSGVDSPMETRGRLLRVFSGLPELETDIRFYDEYGRLVRRLDAGDRASRTAVEYDGRHHIEREKNWEADIGRREEFEDAEWRIVSLVSKDIYATPGDTVERLRRIFRARGISVGPRDDTWRRYFPGRN
ncbi:hypothetical protein FNH13_11970 [Ornithinimicrobium ciconiae]|uniref:DUF559 domain-containing protein n=1 Tax=Ornithinimicrobium ciconiae TaxID=2594265 RepID=A0A516GBP6_9MICO|nr:hypothetical protein [Ornithinimicrobium ciconiae]QDO88949.1 hypothetical protein FNH13_11970 [Ornithinimicrobium ciconiae]